ncbi:MAG TPA: hypothetical protein VFA75_08455 [Nevskia sp.]|nr:hypothetical protein [Nevskia sp.]
MSPALPEVSAPPASSGTDATPLVERASESLRFPGGEWLIRESRRAATATQRGARGDRHFLCYQQDRLAPREALGEICMREAGAATLREAHPLLLRSAGRCAVVLGRYVFQRWDGPWWYRATTPPFGAAAFFLRAWLRDQGEDIGLRLPEVPYGFGHFDLERNVLVTSRERPDPRFPHYLVYSAPFWGCPWRFDPERTRRVNGMPRGKAESAAEDE